MVRATRSARWMPRAVMARADAMCVRVRRARRSSRHASSSAAPVRRPLVTPERPSARSRAAEIRAAGGEAYGYPCDITDDESVEHTVKAVLAEHGHVDMLVNNAGRSIRRGLYHSTERFHDFERTMAVNYFGAVRLILAFLPQMRERRFGHIVNISSAGVQGATPRFAAYVASQHRKWVELGKAAGVKLD